jgi:type III secretion system (T3SS) needle YscE family protein
MSNARAWESAAFFAMTELEEKLKGPDGKSAANAILSRLDNLTAEITAHQHSGPSPRDYSRAEVIGDALAAARTVVISILRVR